MLRGSIAALLVGSALACAGPREDAPAGAGRAATWLPDEAECGLCHEEVAASWAASRHHAAFTNEEFQRAYAREATPFCRECHAPAHDRLPARAAEALGVGCLACHGDGAAIVSGAGRPGAGEAPHALRREAGFGTRACAGCHEFDFPAGSEQPRGTMMQTTLREHRASAHADRSCAACHMPSSVAGWTTHDLASTRDPEAHRRALTVTASREGDALRLELRTREVGHAYPTGDLFRRLAVHASLVTPEGRSIAHQVRYLGRHFVPRRHPDGRLRHEASLPLVDDRPLGAATVEIALNTGEPASAAELVWWVDLERVDARDHEHPERSTIAGTIRLAGGSLAPSRPGP